MFLAFYEDFFELQRNRTEILFLVCCEEFFAVQRNRTDLVPMQRTALQRSLHHAEQHRTRSVLFLCNAQRCKEVLLTRNKSCSIPLQRITLQRSPFNKEHDLFYPFAMQRRPRNKIYYILWQRTALQTRRRESLDSSYHYTVFPLLFSTSTQDTTTDEFPMNSSCTTCLTTPQVTQRDTTRDKFPMNSPVLADAPHLLTFSFTPGGSIARNSSWKRMEEGY